MIEKEAGIVKRVGGITTCAIASNAAKAKGRSGNGDGVELDMGENGERSGGVMGVKFLQSSYSSRGCVDANHWYLSSKASTFASTKMQCNNLI